MTFYFLIHGRGAMALAAATLLVACGPGAGPQPASPQAGPPQRTLVMVSYGEPPHFVMKHGSASGEGSGSGARQPFVGNLSERDDRGMARPVLAESLPQLGTDTWRMLPDGRMETIYRLRSGLKWHDGTSFTADDVVFSWRVYVHPEAGVGPAPQNLLDEVAAVDERTVRFRWRQPTVRAGALSGGTSGFTPLPRHILSDSFEHGDLKAFLGLSYWTRDYVGLGAYRLEQWEPGAFMQGTAFDGYALGRPRIERIRVIFSGNRDAVLATLLAGGAVATVADAIGSAQAAVLEREWGNGGAGIVLASTTDVRYVQIQFKPEVVNPRVLLDLRARKAIAHAIDRQSLADGVIEGRGRVAEAYAAPEHPHYAEIDRAITKYPYDPRRTEQLLAEVGVIKQADGFYRAAAGEPFHLQVLGEVEKELVILADSFRRAGISAGISHLTPVLSRDRELQTVYPALSVRSNHFELVGFFATSSKGRIASEQTRWTGSNRGGYSNPEYDRLYDAQEASLDEGERARLDVSLARLISEDVPGIPVYYQLQFDGHLAALRGPTPYPSDTDRTWNLHEWEWVS